MQYSNFSVILGSLIKQCILFESFLQFSPPTPPPPHPLTLCKILDTRVQHCLWGKGEGWACVNWKTPQKCKSVTRHLSMIVGVKVPRVTNSKFRLRIWL